MSETKGRGYEKESYGSVLLQRCGAIDYLCFYKDFAFLCILAENRRVELLYLHHRTRCTVSIYHISNVSFVTYRCVCIFLGRCINAV